VTLPPIFTPEYYAHWRDFEARHWWTAGMRDVASILFEWVGLPPRGLLLDVGCGSGQGMAWFSGLRPEWRRVGIDPGMVALQAAADLGRHQVIRGSGTALPFPTASVDAVISLDVLQHLPLDGGDRAALSEMHRVLKPGGHLFVRTNVQAFPRVPDDAEAVWHKYEPEELHAKLEGAGFAVLRLSRINALLGLAEIPKEIWRALRPRRHSSYEIVARAHERRLPRAGGLKRAWLRVEGRAVRDGMRLPTGRSLVALCRA